MFFIHLCNILSQYKDFVYKYILHLHRQPIYANNMDIREDIIFVVNPISGTQNKESILEYIESNINRSIYNPRIIRTEYAGHACDIAKQAVADKVSFVVAIGGDGTINEVGCALVHSDTALGIIPCGSGNGLARHLHIPMDYQKAVQLINNANVRLIDYGKIAGHPFFCTCGVGFDAFVSLKFAGSKRRGLITYLENTLKESLHYEPETYEIENSEGTVKYKAFLIACGNASQYGNNAFITPQASLSDGMMDITVLEPFTVLDVPSLSFQLFTKTIDMNSRIKTMKDKKIIIHRATEGVFHFDGDPMIGPKDLVVEIVPSALKVICPPKPKRSIYEPHNILQHITDFIEAKPVSSSIAEKHRQLLEMNRTLMKKLVKKNNQQQDD